MGLNYHSLVLLNDGTVKGFGMNTQGQLGLGNTTTPITTPTLIPNLSNAKQISCGGNHSLILLNDGTVKVFGYNGNGQLGLGNTTQQNSPTLIPSLSNVKQVVCGDSHSLVLLNDGTVKGFGYNINGQLGLGNVTTPITSPTLIPSLTNVKQISCGSSHSLVLLNNGTVKSFGYNAQGQLGLGNVTTPYMSPTLIPNITNVNQISCGNAHSLVLLNDGTVKGFGRNDYGQLGLGNTANSTIPTLIPNLSNVKQIAGGVYYSLVLLNDGTVKAFGYNSDGELGLGNTTISYTTPTLIPSLSNVNQIVCGSLHSLALLNDGTVKAFGYNTYGQLGLGNVVTPYTTPTLIPNLSNVTLLWDNYTLLVILRNIFVMFRTDTKSVYAIK